MEGKTFFQLMKNPFFFFLKRFILVLHFPTNQIDGFKFFFVLVSSKSDRGSRNPINS